MGVHALMIIIYLMRDEWVKAKSTHIRRGKAKLDMFWVLLECTRLESSKRGPCRIYL